jgi:hypothetical protein
VGNALDSDGWNPEDVYEIRSKILNLFETKWHTTIPTFKT